MKYFKFYFTWNTGLTITIEFDSFIPLLRANSKRATVFTVRVQPRQLEVL
jgi:hypothetical protein